MAIELGRLFLQLASVFDDPGLGGLRQSHARIVESIESDGSRVTDLAQQLQMTKQGAGQLVATLVERGLVEQRPDPDDRRAKVLVRTATGDAWIARVHAGIAECESAWRAEVGAADYAVFASVLSRLASRGERDQ